MIRQVERRRGVGGLALLLSLLTFEDTPAQDPEAPRDWTAIVLAGGGCAAAFFGASELETHRMLDLIVFLPLLTGAAPAFAQTVPPCPDTGGIETVQYPDGVPAPDNLSLVLAAQDAIKVATWWNTAWVYRSSNPASSPPGTASA